MSPNILLILVELHRIIYFTFLINCDVKKAFLSTSYVRNYDKIFTPLAHSTFHYNGKQWKDFCSRLGTPLQISFTSLYFFALRHKLRFESQNWQWRQQQIGMNSGPTSRAWLSIFTCRTVADTGNWRESLIGVRTDAISRTNLLTQCGDFLRDHVNCQVNNSRAILFYANRVRTGKYSYSSLSHYFINFLLWGTFAAYQVCLLFLQFEIGLRNPVRNIYKVHQLTIFCSAASMHDFDILPCHWHYMSM